MDLAREEQVYSSDSSPAGWNSPNRDDTYSLSDYGYVEQEKSTSAADDGYVSSVSCTNSVDACSEVSQEEEIDGRLSSKFICGYRSDTKRLNKNRKQRLREFNKKTYITKLKQVIIASDLIKVKPKGKKGFTEYDTLKYTRELIEVLIALRNRKVHQL